MERIAYHLCIAATRALQLSSREVVTPLQITEGFSLAGDVVVVPVLRAGLSLLHAFTHLIPGSKIGYIGLKRNEETLEPFEYYCNIPELSSSSSVIILDPMLATGGSICASVQELKSQGAKHIVVASVIAAPEGIARVESEHPDVAIICATLDESLNDDGYIVPGLGDAGDRAHGTL